MKQNTYKNFFLIKILLISTLILAISMVRFNFNLPQINEREASTANNREIPHLSQTIVEDNNGIVICNAIDYQLNPEICYDGEGGVIIIWSDSRNSGLGQPDIYAQKIASNGTIMWMSNGIVICDATNVQDDFQICSDGDGGAIITWYDTRNDANGDIYAQRVASNGTTMWVANGLVICNEIGTQEYQQICTDGDGGIIITWYDTRNDANGDIYAQRVASNGTAMWAVSGTVICNAINGQSGPQLCSDGDGGAIFTWTDYRDVLNKGVYAQRIASNGTMMWEVNGTVISNAKNDQRSSQICSDGAGGAIITWYDARHSIDGDVYAQRIASNGTTMWATNGIVISNATDHQRLIQICCDGTGGAFITWEDERNAFFTSPIDLYAQRISSNGIPVWTANGTVICNTIGNQQYPQICYDGVGSAIITWQDIKLGGIFYYDIYAQKIALNGATMWEANGTIICNAANSQRYPQICSNGAGDIIITWDDDRAIPFEAKYDVYAQKLASNGTKMWINYRSLDDTSGNGGGGGGGDDETGTESNLIFISLISAIVIAGLLISYSVIKKKQRQASSGRYGELPITKGKGNLIFLSYSVQDSKMFQIFKIAEKLTSYPEISDVFYCEEDVEDDFVKYMDENIRKCNIVLIFFSEYSLNSDFVDLEWKTALALGKKIIPIFTNEIYIPPLLVSKFGVKFNENDLNGTIDLIYQTIKKVAEIPVSIKISRGFEVAGDTFKFFIRIENALDLAITNVTVKILLPNTLKLDTKSPTEEILIGHIKPHKFGTAIFYMYCEACADTEINAEIDFNDPKGKLQVDKMPPFPILSCKFMSPRMMSREEFNQKFPSTDKKTIEIKLKEGVSEEKAMQMIKDRMTMSTVSSTSNSLEMSGKARDGSELLFKSMIKESGGAKTVIATVGSTNQHVMMGVLSEIIETFMEFREETIRNNY